jgi:starch synthase
LNGIDTQVYDPATDPALKVNYTVKDLKSKRLDKRALQRRLGLPEKNVPLLAVISRLTRQKGIDLLLDSLDPFLQRQDVQLVVLGTGEPALEQAWRTYQQAYPQKVVAAIQFDTQLAQQIYAASDLFLMPSAFEPCGLSQMMAMHYGSLPVVHAVGGLRDTVLPYNQYTGQGTGFSFDDYRPEVFRKMLTVAVNLYRHDPQIWRQLQHQAMTCDFGWERSAQQYRTTYLKLMR